MSIVSLTSYVTVPALIITNSGRLVNSTAQYPLEIDREIRYTTINDRVLCKTDDVMMRSMQTLPCLITLALLISLLASCQPTTARSTELEQATGALRSYFQTLSEGRYADAVDLYGGSYEPLTGYNPAINAQEYARLFEQGCAANGLQCLQVNEILQSDRLDDHTYQFLVSFTGRNGQAFVLGPCCGADETQMPPVSQFTYTVKRVDGNFKVMELPVYVP